MMHSPLSLSLIALTFLTGGVWGLPQAHAVSGEVRFAPHRAIYDVTLERSTPGSGLSDLAGRMVYELTGNPCEGYEQRFRYVTVTTSQEGVSWTGDLRSSTWEDAEGRRLRFNSNQYQNHQLATTTEGEAARQGATGEVVVDLAKPGKRHLEFPSGIFFPLQHSAALLAAARAGQQIFTADLYDGSDKGDKFSHTTAIIGRQTPPGAVKMPASLKGAGKLDASPSWLVSISFFDSSKEREDAVPTAEQSFRYYENGVSTDLVTNFGNYTLRFELKELTFLDQGRCPGGKH